jgi:hypothetical protein
MDTAVLGIVHEIVETHVLTTTTALFPFMTHVGTVLRERKSE